MTSLSIFMMFVMKQSAILKLLIKTKKDQALKPSCVGRIIQSICIIRQETEVLLILIILAKPQNALSKNPDLATTLGERNFLFGWRELGPHTITNVTGHYSAGIGRIEDIWVNPDNENLIYISSRSGGFWKTTDGGGEWTGNSTDFLPATGVNTFSVKPDNPNHILINLRNARNGYSHGVYRSTDGGTNI